MAGFRGEEWIACNTINIGLITDLLREGKDIGEIADVCHVSVERAKVYVNFVNLYNGHVGEDND